jgi:hypothetical protein
MRHRDNVTSRLRWLSSSKMQEARKKRNEKMEAYVPRSDRKERRVEEI